MSFTRFGLLNRTETRLLNRKLTEVVRRWAGEWFPDDDDATITLIDPREIESPRHHWLRAIAHGNLMIAVGAPIGATWGLGTALTGRIDAADGVVGSIGRELEGDVVRALARALLDATGRVGASESVAWDERDEDHRAPDAHRGFVAATCELHAPPVKLSVILYPDTTAAYLAELGRSPRSHGATVSVRRAIESQPVRLHVVLGEAELLLHEIATLRAGDVLRLDRLVTEPLRVIVPEGGLLGRAYLGATGGRKAVQISFAHDGDDR